MVKSTLPSARAAYGRGLADARSYDDDMGDHDNTHGGDGPAPLHNNDALRAQSEGRARSLANLRPWKPGQSGNPAGRPNHGQKLLGWLNELACETADGKARYSLVELRRIADDPDEPHPKAEAAATIIRARSEGWSKAGIPFASNDLDRIFDRCLGKPKQTIAVERAERSMHEIEVDMRESIAGDAQLRQFLERVLVELPALPAPSAQEETPAE